MAFLKLYQQDYSKNLFSKTLSTDFQGFGMILLIKNKTIIFVAFLYILVS